MSLDGLSRIRKNLKSPDHCDRGGSSPAPGTTTSQRHIEINDAVMPKAEKLVEPQAATACCTRLEQREV